MATLVVPEPDTPTFVEVPRLVEVCLTGDGGSALGVVGRYRHVVLVFLDALGRVSLEPHLDHPLMRRIQGDGRLLPLRAQFPSTTAAHVTTLHTGLPVGTHGIYEWHVYEPTLNRVICPLPFSFAGDHVPESLVGNLSPDALLPFETVYERLGSRGLRTAALADAAIIPSSYADRMLRGVSEVVRIHTLPQAFAATRRLVEAGANYVMIYDGSIDYLGHMFGPGSDECHAQIDARLTLIDRQLVKPLQGDGSTLLLITADHGQMPIQPDRVIYLNECWPEVAALVRRGSDDQPLLPSGSARDMFLHVPANRVREVEEGIGQALGDRVDVYETDDLIEQGVFGPDVGDRLRRRIGNIAILLRDGTGGWVCEPSRFGVGLNQRGSHGRLSGVEMLTFLAALPL